MLLGNACGQRQRLELCRRAFGTKFGHHAASGRVGTPAGAKHDARDENGMR